jgi:ParB family transcriptional regulator, chromosome partitioning protein
MHHWLLGGVTEELLLGNPQQFEDNSIRVERLLLEMVRPDPVQPRRVLPEQLHFAFHSNRLTPTQALKELVQLVQVAARQRGRPFNSVLELLPNPDDDSDEELAVQLSPEEQLLHDLVNLAITIRDDGRSTLYLSWMSRKGLRSSFASRRVNAATGQPGCYAISYPVTRETA